MTNVRQLIDRYQLDKFQLVFSITRLFENGRVPVIYAVTSAFSIIMAAETSLLCPPKSNVQYAPRTGDVQGGEKILMVIPRLDPRKCAFASFWTSVGLIFYSLAFQLNFEHHALHNIFPVEITSLDSKTVSFRTPPCPRDLQGNQTLSMDIVVTQNNAEIARVDFLYRASKLICALLVKTLSQFSLFLSRRSVPQMWLYASQ